MLVVVLPGIGGTVLAEPGPGGRLALDRFGEPRMVWSASLCDATLLTNPQRLSLTTFPELVPLGLLPTRMPFGLFTAVHGYERLVQSAASAVPDAVIDWGEDESNLDATVVAFGYDFRLGVAHAAGRLDRQLAQRVTRLWGSPERARGRVIFVGHSMGGLVARYWTATTPVPEVVRAIITLGTPHRGAPKALDVMANGYPVGPIHLTKLRDLAREWPGMWDLLPRYPVIPDTTGSPRAEGGLLRPHEAGLDWLTQSARAGWDMHQVIQSGWRALEVPPAVVPRIGFSHRTIRQMWWQEGQLRASAEVMERSMPEYWARALGDGTVPAVSGLPVEKDNEIPLSYRVPDKHGSMVDLDVAPLISRFLQLPAPGPLHRDGGPAGVVLGLDMDDAWPAGRPIPVGVSVWAGADEEYAVQPLPEETLPAAIATLTDISSGRQAPYPVCGEVTLAWDSGSRRFVGRFPGVGPGVYAVRASVEQLTDHGATQVLEVVDDALA